MRVEKELQEIAASEIENQESLAKNVDLILKNLQVEDHKFLSDRGYNIHAPQVRKKNIYRHEEIEAIAIKYRLRFLPLRKFKADIDVQCIQKMKEYEEQTKEQRYSGKPEYLILAPADNFHLKKFQRNKDPLLFVHHSYEEGFVLLNSWGNDLSYWRKILYAPLRYEPEIRILSFFMLVGSIVLTACSANNYWNAAVTVASALMIPVSLFGLLSSWSEEISSEFNWDRDTF